MDNQDNSNLAQTYNDIPYTSYVFAHCQPTRLHALAKIKGLNPPPLETATVLEIGCSFGGNLLPFAIRYPNSKIIGIDLATTQIEIGQQMMREIGIKNVHLIAGDISKVIFEQINFDYIICHGVFSWVPDFVQEAILNTIEKYLSPNGVAFISYNTYPGWHLKDMAKELMIFGSDDQLDRLSRVDQAFEMLKYTDNIIKRRNSNISPEISKVFNEIVNKSKYYVAHEFFEDYNHPLYFREFNNKIQSHNLAYLTDSDSPSIVSKFIFNDKEHEQIYQYFNNNIEKIEQYTDFVTHRTFRTSLITRKENMSNRDIYAYDTCFSFLELFLKTNVEYIINDEQKIWKIVDGNLQFPSNDLTDKLAEYLNKKESPVNIRKLIKKLEKEPNYDKNLIKGILFHIVHSHSTYLCYSSEELTKYSKKPHISEKLRKLIQVVNINPNITSLSNQFYQIINLDKAIMHISQYFDGTKTIKDIIEIVKNDIDNGFLDWKSNEKLLKSHELKDKDIRDYLNNVLDILYKNGFFNHYN
ncbi:class I SAM-dependent methyltransferase [Otariodibacter oris]|uniref:Methyltransferase-like protein n=1 Tax=Otariodibacter oris TaxID=1032623 RepID=A0A420XFE2_9PAST|nr:class I SAM-dependent methyltransferase [Otariodibacter oris]RKR71253.1 methyltransferase-like protein [Otariodibacter oris]